jgi:hypothetical protein
MRCSSQIFQLLLACALTTALANPHVNAHTQISQRGPPTADTAPATFHLKTRVHAGEDQRKNGLYVGLRHTGSRLLVFICSRLPNYVFILFEKSSPLHLAQ